jgi:hypothetical protein
MNFTKCASKSAVSQIRPDLNYHRAGLRARSPARTGTASLFSAGGYGQS